MQAFDGSLAGAMWLGDADAQDASVVANGGNRAEAWRAPVMMPISDSDGEEALEWQPLEWAWHGEEDDARETTEMVEQAEANYCVHGGSMLRTGSASFSV